MVKNSKYILTLMGFVLCTMANAQMGSGQFNAIQRDLEVSRVTFENYLKKWNGDPLLNVFRDSKGEYTVNKGIHIDVLAENASIYLSAQNGNFQNADDQIMDTFFSDPIIDLQKSRLKEAITQFLLDYKSYLPKLENNENIVFNLEIRDAKERNSKREEVKEEPSPLEYKRTYTLQTTLKASDFNQFKTGSLDENGFKQKINFEIK